MFNFFKKSIKDDAKDFEDYNKIANVIIFKYLDIWFKQIFSTPEWKEIFADKPKMHTTMAAEVMRYLLALDDSRDSEELKNNDAAIMAKEHAVKWSDDVMSRDKEFCNFVVQTLLMDSVFCQYFNGTEWTFNDPRCRKVYDILMKYGHKISGLPNPKKYKKLLIKWMAWDKIIDEKINNE